jgi:hypothetical protein
MTDKLEYAKPLGKAVPLLLENGYNGYSSGEYEGPRYALAVSGHLARQQARLK